MQLAVTTVVVELGMLRKVVLSGMLHHQPAVGEQQIVLKHVVDDLLDIRQIVGRISEDDIELLTTRGGIGESVLTNHRHLVVVFQQVYCLLDKLGTQEVFVHSHHRKGASGGKLVGDVARAGKEVQHPHVVEIEVVVQDVEEALFAHVHGRAHRQVGGRHDVSASVFSTDDSHILENDGVQFVGFQQLRQLFVLLREEMEIHLRLAQIELLNHIAYII